MFCLQDVTKEYYTYENKEKLDKILQFDSFGQVNLDLNYNIIYYELDRRRVYRLTDFIFLISKYAIKIYVGQLLVLLQKLIERVIFLQKQEIIHNTLDMNRVWLQFKDTSELPSASYQQFDYEIHFTGYQCPFYEQGNNQNSVGMNVKILLILQDILNNVYHCFEESNTKQKGAINKLFAEIFKNCQQLDLQILLKGIQNELKSGNFQQSSQTIDQDKVYSSDQNNSIKQKTKIWSSYIQQIINRTSEYKQFSSTLQESSLFNSVNLFIIEEKGEIKYQQQIRVDQITINSEYFQNFNNNLKQSLQQIFEPQYKNQIEKLQSCFKFDFSKIQQNIFDDIVQAAMDVFLQKYFSNTIWLYKGNQTNLLRSLQIPNPNFDGKIQITLMDKLIKYLVEGRLELEIQIMILQLINNLI